jgi:hypothetical protein
MTCSTSRNLWDPRAVFMYMLGIWVRYGVEVLNSGVIVDFVKVDILCPRLVNFIQG